MGVPGAVALVAGLDARELTEVRGTGGGRPDVDAREAEAAGEDEGGDLAAAEGDESGEDAVEVRVVRVGEEDEDVDERGVCVWRGGVVCVCGVCVFARDPPTPRRDSPTPGAEIALNWAVRGRLFIKTGGPSREHTKHKHMARTRQKARTGSEAGGREPRMVLACKSTWKAERTSLAEKKRKHREGGAGVALHDTESEDDDDDDDDDDEAPGEKTEATADVTEADAKEVERAVEVEVEVAVVAVEVAAVAVEVEVEVAVEVDKTEGKKDTTAEVEVDRTDGKEDAAVDVDGRQDGDFVVV